MATITESQNSVGLLFDMFRMRATAVSAEVERVSSKALALEFIVRTLNKEDVADKAGSRALWAAPGFLDAAERAQLQSAVPGLRFEVTRELAAEAKVGISRMDWALANTGTLVQTADAVEQRLVSTLPPLHIAIVSTQALLPDLPAVLARIDPRKSAYLAFITGPSRTADIERVLTIGVHGPGRLMIVMVDDLEGAR
jgi:L-lactate dehydrogenase complex protein LldG